MNMKAAVYRTYGPPEVLKIEEIETPDIQEGHADRVLIKVDHASVNPFDFLYRKGYFPVRLSNGLTQPKQQILGIDVAGTVEKIGKNVKQFKVGDPVFGNCLGSHAEYVRARQNSIGLIPKNLTFKEAAAIPTAALTALQALRYVAQIKKGHRILVYGASGGVGHFAVQIAKFLEAEVTAVCSTTNLSWVRDLGADYLIDYTKEDFTKNGKQYDVILDAVAKLRFFKCKPSLTSTGKYITENPLKPVYHPLQLILATILGGKRGKTHLSQPNAKDLDFLRKLIEAGKLIPIIEKTYPLNEIVEAHRHIEGGHTKGKIVVEI
jgi:NADPH:quinone reductase-like Zn-dependent oxidoreductase